MKSLATLVLVLAGSISFGADEEAPTLVQTVRAVLTSDLETELVFTGTVVSKRQADLSSRAEGLVEKVLVDAGSVVKEGDLLMQLDTRLAEIDLKLVQAEIAAAEVQLADATRQRDEVLKLASQGAFAKTEASSREATVRIRQAELEALRVREEQQKEVIERHRLVAPFAGTIGEKSTEAGEWVDTGSAVFELVETDDLWFDLQIAQEFLATVGKANSATLYLDAYPGKAFVAKIDVVVPMKDPVSRTFLTRLTFEDPEGLASPGISGTAELQVKPEDSASVTIPRDAVMRYPDGSAKVWRVVEEDGVSVVRSLTVIIGGSLGETVEVTGGLMGGEPVVVRGNEDLTEGQKVDPREDSKTKGIDGL